MAVSPQRPQAPARNPQARPRAADRIDYFWTRVTEGQALDQLWRQFVTEARASYRVYSRDVPRQQVPGARGAQFFYLVKEWFWAILTKLSPARRVLLLVGLVLLLIPLQVGREGSPPSSIYGGILILLVLIMELADRVVMKRDLEIAREIQHWLVPPAPPTVANLDIAFTTRPANTVSGDYYDVFPWRTSDGASHFLVVVADVAGKSVPAALLMATFHASLHSLAGSTASLLDLVQGVNRYSSAHSSGGQRFTTAFLADFDATTGALAYINAGHNAPMLRRANGAIERLDVGGLPLGIRNEAVYEQDTKMLAAGDTLVVFTDGVIEATNPRGEDFGESRLLSCVSPVCGPATQLLQLIMGSVDRFVGTAPQQDDITCLIARMNNAK
jgi:sigma-B regulation protein RsbU (phosphoserine phosphatase)